MGRFDDRLQQLRDEAERGIEGLAQLSDDERAGDTEAVVRLEHALAYAGLVLEGTDGELVSETAFQAVSEQLVQICGNPAGAIANAPNWGDGLLDAISRLPGARDQDVAQAAREAAANYQRSVQQRLNALSEEIEAVQSRVGDVRTSVDGAKTELETQFEEEADSLRTRLAEFEQTLANERSLIEQTKTSQAETFRQAQAERADEAQKALAATNGDLTTLLSESGQEVERRVEEIRRMEAESSGLVGAIGLAGTAERYGLEVDEQKKAADFWRWATVAFVGLAVVALAIVVLTLGDDPQWEAFLGKLSASIALGGIATYAARQSARHRLREENARALQLELTAFGPFIEPLIPEQREEERVIMTRKTFGKTSAATPAAGEEPGPAPLSSLLRRREKDQ